MKLIPVTDVDYVQFHALLSEYYRDGEDANTPQEQLDGFIRYLHDLCMAGSIFGAIAILNEPVGFVLWCIDSEDSPFRNRPGFGTILEIGVCKDKRGFGYGKQMTEFAELSMDVSEYYVCAYGPAERFWQKCGYSDSGHLAENGLKLMVKGDSGGR
jgi:GNAT superfamily N-acetyltransferase